jgi:hypothetical protein
MRSSPLRSLIVSIGVTSRLIDPGLGGFECNGLFLPVENFCFVGEPDACCHRITLLMQPRVLRPGFFQDGNIGIGVLSTGRGSPGRQSLPSLQDQVAGVAPRCHDEWLNFSEALASKDSRGALCRISRRIQQVHRNSHQTNVALTRPPSPSGWRKRQMKWRMRLRKSRNNMTKITIFSRSES